MSGQTASEELAASLAMTLDGDKVHAVIVFNAPRFYELGEDEREKEFAAGVEGLARDLHRELDAWKERQA